MQDHRHSFVVEASPEEVWAIFWSRQNYQGDGVSIEILHPGDEVGNGLVRYCTFRVPKYLLSGGVGQSWEWLTEVVPLKSWKYGAVGKPLWSRAEGWTELEDLGDGRTRIHFRETYHAFNPLLRLLLEHRVHKFISDLNDRVIPESIEEGLRRVRAAGSAAAS